MLQAVFHGVALLWIKHEHLLKQAVCVWVRLREDLLHGLLVALGQLANVAASKIVSDKAHVVARWRAQHCNSALNLVKVVVAGE